MDGGHGCIQGVGRQADTITELLLSASLATTWRAFVSGCPTQTRIEAHEGEGRGREGRDGDLFVDIAVVVHILAIFDNMQKHLSIHCVCLTYLVLYLPTVVRTCLPYATNSPC